MTATTQTNDQLRVWVRLLRTACIAMAVAMPLFVAMAMSGVGGYRGGWLWASAIAAPAMAAVGWAGWGRARGRRAVTAALALGGLAFGGWISQEAALSHGRLREAMGSITVPATFERIGDTAGGWSLCFDECPSYSRYWVTTGDVESARARLHRILEDEGFVLGNWGADKAGGATVTGNRGRLGVSASVGTRWVWKNGEPVRPSPGQLGVAVTLDTDDGY